MVDYLAPISRGHLIGVIVGVYNLQTIFDERYYDNLPGGLLEAFGRGFGHNVKMYVYPANNVETGNIYELDNFKVPENLRGLLQYMKDNNKLANVENYDSSLLGIISDDVLSKIKVGASSWEEDVPSEVVEAIKHYQLFGYKPTKKELHS